MPRDRATELLRTKLHTPRPREGAVKRDRLLGLLDRASASTLTLVSAPAGFGKTTLVAEWLQHTSSPAGWFSLDPEDDDPVRFWSYFVEAMRSVDAGLGSGALDLLTSGATPASDVLASLIVNETALSGESIVCVLDDFHFITSRPLSEAVLFLVRNAPPTLRLIITSRADPPWPLARLRADGRIAEIRAAQLRFDADEARAFLETAGHHLDAATAQRLERRTEGWVAGLQMAALSMHGREDPAAFIDDFAGSHRFVLDYLTEEVLARQPQDVVDFLMRTSILDRLTGALCDAVTGETGGETRLRGLERGNLFTDPLDDERRWFRYHPLLSDVLRSRLRASSPALVPELHRRAAAWFEQHSLLDEAIHHALESGDARSAAGLIRRTASATFMVSSQQRVLHWLDRLPSEIIGGDPELALMRAWARFVIGDMEGIDDSIAVAVGAISMAASAAEQAALEAQLDAMRAWIAYQRGDLDGCIRLALASRDRLPRDGLVPARTATMALASALVLVGDLDTADALLAEVRVQGRRAHDRLSESLALAMMGQVELVRGRPAGGRTACLEAIEVGTVAGEPLPPVGIAQVLLGEAHRELGDLPAAEEALVAGIAMCEAAMGVPEWVYEGYVTLARVVLSGGDRRRAAGLIAGADKILHSQLVPGGMEPLVRRALAYRAGYAVAAGEASGTPEADGRLVEPLKPRELELLRLLAQQRSNQEIAGELYLSVNTVKWHARNLYGKLGVEGRGEAVARAKDLGII